MLKPETKTDSGQFDTDHRQIDFHMVEGQVIVAIIEADCVECAFKIRDEKYPRCRLDSYRR